MPTGTDKTPTFIDFFKSFFYKNTYLPPIALDEKWMEKHALKGDVADKIRKLPEEIQKILSTPLSYNLERVDEYNSAFVQKKFRLLGQKQVYSCKAWMPYYSVVEHDKVKDWVIKHGSKRFSKGAVIPGVTNDLNEKLFFHEDDSLLRIEMAQRIIQIANEAKISDNVVIPKKKVVRFVNNSGQVILAQKIQGLSKDDTFTRIQQLKTEEQETLAHNIATLVEKVGFADANFNNIFISDSHQIVFLDTEPAGLMAVKKPGLWKRLFGYEQASVEKCARIGLYTLMKESEGKGVPAFHEELKKSYEKVRAPRFSRKKIFFACLSLGLIPLTIALVKSCLIKIYTYLLKNREKMKKRMISLKNSVPCVS